MQEPNWLRLESKYWKPTKETEYLVEFANPRNGTSNFGKENVAPKEILILDVLAVSTEEKNSLVEYNPPREFSTCNQTFIEGIKPIIKKAILKGQDTIAVHLRRDEKGNYSLFSFNPEMKRGFLL